MEGLEVLNLMKGNDELEMVLLVADDDLIANEFFDEGFELKKDSWIV